MRKATRAQCDGSRGCGTLPPRHPRSAAADLVPPGKITVDVVTVNGSAGRFRFDADAVPQELPAEPPRALPGIHGNEHARHRGAHSDNWQSTHTTGVAEIMFAPCGAVRHLNVNTEVRAFTNSANQPAFVSMDSTDGSIKTRYQFAWKRC